MLFWLDFHQTQSNLYRWFRMQRHDWSSTNPKEPMLHLSLSACTGSQVAARIQFKTLMLAYRTTTGSAPSYFHSLITIYIPSRSLRSASERRLVVPSQKVSKITLQNILVHRSWLVEWTSTLIQNLWQFSSDTRKLISSVITWLHLKKKTKQNFTLFPWLCSLSLNLSLSRICSEQCLEICITSTSCVCWPLYNVSLIVFLNCKSLWIKASAKWIHLNVVQLLSRQIQMIQDR